jgi:tetratricopeptide (TPR) repeat protein
MERPADFFRGLMIFIVGLVMLVFLLIRWFRRTQDEPRALVVKWGVSAGLIICMLVSLVPAIARGGWSGAFMVPFVAFCGLVLAILWTPNVVGWFSQKIENLYTGGDVPPQPEPAYSTAEACRKRGQFQEAITHIQAQLEQFPSDVTGHLLLAEVQARDLRDLSAARQTIEGFCAQPGHAAENIWLALNSLAEWYLQYAQDIPSARQALEKIIELLPKSNPAQRAEQRLAMLANPENFHAIHDRTPIQLKAGCDRVGLLENSSSLKRPEEDPEKKAAELALQLEEHPQDQNAREQLAILYSNHYQNLSLATEQLEILIQHPQQSMKTRVRLLNLLADLQIRHAQSYDTVRQTLQRIIDLNPEAATAAQARQRLDYVRLDLKAKEKGRVVKLGTYEQNIGLKKP